MLNYPFLLLFPFSLFVLWIAARIGVSLRTRSPLTAEEREDFGFVQAATLTLLGLIMGFSFSMSIGRYDQRKNYEESEANAIGTEYARTDLMPSTDAAKVRQLLKEYLVLRIQFYRTRDRSELQRVNNDVTQRQSVGI